ncbi:MAG TPA: PIG-L family deacetylase [Acidimicrobiales bacterium]
MAPTPRTPLLVRSPSDVAPLGTLLGVWAHPDDETYLSGGLMALAAAAGSRVVCVTATRGERGGPRGWPADRTAAIRQTEMAAALAALGPIEHRWLGHADGGCREVPWSLGVSQVMAVIEEVQPRTIVTFGPEGMTGHDDHRAVSGWVTGAWQLKGCPAESQLLHSTTAPGWLEANRSVNRALQVFGPEGPPTTATTDLALVTELDEMTLDRKLVALRAHASQTRSIEERVGTEALRSWWATECFRPVAPLPTNQTTHP